MKPKKIGVFDAKTRPSELLERVGRGEVYVITKRGRPVAELRPVPSPTGLRFGTDKGRVKVGVDFDDPLRDMQEYT